jgi:hypothetical protein
MTRLSEDGSVTDLGCEGQEKWERGPADGSQPRPQAWSDVAPLHVSRSPEETMSTTTDHYLVDLPVPSSSSRRDYYYRR